MSRVIRSVTDAINLGCTTTPEINIYPSKTDRSGYVRPSKLIPRMLEAGVLLERNRATNGYYEYDSSVPVQDLQVDPTTRKDFDVIEAAEISARLQAKYDAHLQSIREAKAAKDAVLAHQAANPSPAVQATLESVPVKRPE